MQIDCIIVEDEPLAQERLKGYVLKLPFLKLLATFDNGIEALLFLKSNRTDLVFLDISMGEFSGIQLLEASDIPSEIIIITAYDKYALKGFDLNVTDYLLKPYTFERFLQAVGRAQHNLAKNEGRSKRNFIFVKAGHRLEKLMLDEVLYIEGMRDYRKIYTITRKIMTLQTFTDLEQEIPADLICRVHKSYMVALDKIDSVEKDRIRIREAIIPVSETYKKSFLRLINHLGG